MLIQPPGPGIREIPQARAGLAGALGGKTRMTPTSQPTRVGIVSSTTVPVAFIRSFAELSKADVAYAGGKGANLGELTSAGVPVPPGFVIGAPAYATFCQEAGVRGRLDEILAALDIEDTGALEAASAAARQAVLDAPMPPALKAAIVSAYGDLAGAERKDGEPDRRSRFVPRPRPRTRRPRRSPA